VYGRTLGEQELTFEASGGLIHGTLVLQDRETDSYWPIMAGRSLSGPLAGSRLDELAVARKRRWRDWRDEHPDTLVLSVDGAEDAPPAYDEYFASDEGFRGLAASDDRLPTKEPIFAFRIDGVPVAAPHSTIIGGKTFHVEGVNVLLYRAPGASLFESTRAWSFLSSGECLQSPGHTVPEHCTTELPGFDTFWYSWSLNNPDSYLLDEYGFVLRPSG